jgi:hypothetical protein
LAVAVSAIVLAVASYGLSRQALVSCGATVFGFVLSNCVPAEPVATVRDDSRDRLAALAAEAEHLERQLRAVRTAVAQRPVCPAPPVAPSRAPPVPPPPVRPTVAPAIDDSTWRKREVASLQGCWDLDSDYRVQDTDTKVVATVTAWSICLEPNGTGRQNIKLSDGVTCESTVSARFPTESSLAITDVGDVMCSNKSRIFQREIECARQTTSQIACDARQPTQGTNSAVKLRRRPNQP